MKSEWTGPYRAQRQRIAKMEERFQDGEQGREWNRRSRPGKNRTAANDWHADNPRDARAVVGRRSRAKGGLCLRLQGRNLGTVKLDRDWAPPRTLPRRRQPSHPFVVLRWRIPVALHGWNDLPTNKNGLLKLSACLAHTSDPRRCAELTVQGTLTSLRSTSRNR